MMLGLRPEMIFVRKDAQVATLSTTRRCLFGPVDHCEVGKAIRTEMANLDKENCDKYNFNFSTESPMDGGGHYDWIALRGTEFVPSAYKLGDFDHLTDFATILNVVKKEKTSQKAAANKPQQRKTRRVLRPRARKPMAEISTNAGEVFVKAAQQHCRETRQSCRLGKRKQSQITDFFAQRKCKLARQDSTKSLS